MAVYLPKYRAADGTRKVSRVYWIEFRFQGQEVRESTGTRSKTLAKRILDKRRRDLEEGAAGVRRRPLPRIFSYASDLYLESKKNSVSPSTLLIDKTNLRHLKPEFGRLLVCDIDAPDVAAYQQKRLKEGASPATVNLEIGTLRAILRKHGMWARLQPDAKMLPTNNHIGQAITPQQETALLQACSESRSRCLLPFVILAIETGARYGVIRTLQWQNIDFAQRCLQFGKDKTKAGTGRVVPLNQRGLAVLLFWASNFPQRQPEHFVFPKERYGGSGEKDQFGFRGGVPYESDPTEPIGDVKEGWELAKKRAGICCRFHDLRHTAVSRMLDAGVPITKVAKIVGWAPSTMVHMAARYGHFSLDELRGAVESISRGDEWHDPRGLSGPNTAPREQ